MRTSSKSRDSEIAATLAREIPEALLRERVIPRFVDSYVVEHGRYGLQVHASLYRDLLTLLQREALLAASSYALESLQSGRLNEDEEKPLKPLPVKQAALLRRKFLEALSKHQRWNAGAALEFQSDFQIYEELGRKNSGKRRSRKPFEAANHPFVDRCAFLLDSSFLEKARLAASRALSEIERICVQISGPHARELRGHTAS